MVIAYGAGKKAKEFLPDLLKYGKADEVWDKNASGNENLYDIPIVRPHPQSVNDDTLVLIFIDDISVRIEVSKWLFGEGIKHIFWYKDALKLLAERTSIEGLVEDYKIIGYDDAPVIFEYLPVKSDEGAAKKAYSLEIFLRKRIKDKPKTSYRPIRMAEDNPYDPFAVYEHIKQFFKEDSCWNEISYEKKLNLIDKLIMLSQHKKVVERFKIDVYMENSDYSSSLLYAQDLCHKYPNSLFINDCFFEVATICKKEGISVEESLPEYDLSERFCWCGISFAWCGGINKEDGSPIWGPCFRPNQCSAKPQGPFWEGEEWKEFRKSLLDGSFRYCQKTECPNIVAGWLPKKSIIDVDMSVIPPLEEVHLSYDAHCNLCCPSCRTEFCIDSKEIVEEYDRFYEEHIREYVRKAKHLCLSGCGEAILSPHSNKILKSLSRKEYPDLEVELRTNVTSVTPTSWKELGEGSEVIRHIAVSIDSSEKDVFEKLRYPAKWDMVRKNLRFIQSLRNNGQLDMFEFHVVVQADNVTQLLDIVKMAMDYDADAVTFSRIINWRGMETEEYDSKNPFWPSHALHETLKKEFERIEKFRNGIEDRSISYKKKLYINMHFIPDPNDSYDEIRSGKIRIR